MASSFPHYNSLVKGPKVRRQASRRVQSGSPRRGDSLTLAFSRLVLSPCPWPRNQAKEPKHLPQKPARRAEAVGLQTCRSRSGWGAPGRFPCPLRGQTRPEPPRSQHWLPPSRGPPSRAGRSGPPRSSPFRPGQPSVRQSVTNSVHTERLPAPAGSSSSAGQEVWPPPTHTPTRSPPSRAVAVPQEVPARGPLACAGQAGLARRGKALRSPASHSFPLGLCSSVVCEARKTGSVNSRRDVTASLLQWMG